MNHLKFISFSMLLSLIVFKSNGQQLNLNQNSHFNLLNENIGFAGNYNATHFSVNYYKLWSVKGAPTSFNFSAHMPLQKRKLGLAIKADRTAIGAHEEVSVKGVFAYKLAVGSGRLSFGIGGGFRQYNFNSSELVVLDVANETYNFSELNNTILDVDFGIIYTDNRNFIGLEINQLTSSDWNINDTDNSTQIPHFKIAGGHVFPMKELNFLRVSAHIRSDTNFQLQSDLLLNYLYQNKIWIGCGIRIDYGLLAQLEINFSKRFHAGYTGGVPLYTSVKTFTASHSVFLGYMLPNDKSQAPSLGKF
ncbi:MAG: PorP/SprF family type IX secretion system membrane protein [Flavobacteriales bacterium]|jgi:type IX secretion system PorP/SprF family membrane protein|tara:strand:+ start:1397 stop:2311 length:915 start_codon:yes stop_codon:yes gene_type:complete